MEGGDNSPRIEEETSATQKSNTSQADAFIKVSNEDTSATVQMKSSEEVVQSVFVETSKFSETNKRIRYMYRNARQAEARETIEKYIAENYKPEELDIEELSKIYIRYVIVL